MCVQGVLAFAVTSLHCAPITESTQLWCAGVRTLRNVACDIPDAVSPDAWPPQPQCIMDHDGRSIDALQHSLMEGCAVTETARP